MRVLAIEGHHGVLDSFEHWRSGRDVPTTTGVAFSHQLFDALHAVGATATVIAQHAQVDSASARGITVEHTGRVLFGRDGLDYHREMLSLATSLIARAVREQIDVIMTVGYPPSGLLLPLLHMGRHLVVVHHCVLWPTARAPTRGQRLLFPLERFAYRHPRCHVLAVSDDVVAQIARLRGEQGPPIVRFFPLFRREVFDGIPPVDPRTPTLKVGFIGRIERSKGIFDVVEAVRLLRADGVRIELACCGDGSARAELLAEIERAGLSDAVVSHGWCDQARLRAIMESVHVVVAPTRADFVEGFNMVVVEALLAGRPVITTRICPALEYVRGPAAIEVGVECADDLVRALRRLADDRKALAHAASHARPSAECFFDERYSYRTACTEVLSAIAEQRLPRPVAPSAESLRRMRASRESDRFVRHDVPATMQKSGPSRRGA